MVSADCGLLVIIYMNFLMLIILLYPIKIMRSISIGTIPFFYVKNKRGSRDAAHAAKSLRWSVNNY